MVYLQSFSTYISIPEAHTHHPFRFLALQRFTTTTQVSQGATWMNDCLLTAVFHLSASRFALSTSINILIFSWTSLSRSRRSSSRSCWASRWFCRARLKSDLLDSSAKASWILVQRQLAFYMRWVLTAWFAACTKFVTASLSTAVGDVDVEGTIVLTLICICSESAKKKPKEVYQK